MDETRKQFIEPEILKHDEKMADVTMQIGLETAQLPEQGAVGRTECFRLLIAAGELAQRRKFSADAFVLGLVAVDRGRVKVRRDDALGVQRPASRE